MSAHLAAKLRTAGPFFLIAGPCVLESEKIAMTVAHRLKEMQERLGIPIVFKSSFDKANRQHIDSFRGPGLQLGLDILNRIKQETDLPILTDVHDVHQIDMVAKVADIVQIPAFLCRQTDLLVAAAKSGRIVNIKKGQMCSAETLVMAAQKVHRITNNFDFMLTERGTMFGYNDLIVDPRNLPKLRESGGMVIQDVTHSVQQLGGSISGGNREFIPTIARMAAAVGVDGMFIETHPRPEEAFSDSSSMLPINELEPLMMELINIANVSHAKRDLSSDKHDCTTLEVV